MQEQGSAQTLLQRHNFPFWAACQWGHRLKG
jgi:hypothetical protein